MRAGYDKIIGLIQTEKASRVFGNGQYTIKVKKDCSKQSLKAIIKTAFGVDAVKINTVNVSGKKKIFRGSLGVRPSYKKVIFTVKDGQSINFQDLKA